MEKSGKSQKHILQNVAVKVIVINFSMLCGDRVRNERLGSRDLKKVLEKVSINTDN